MFILAWLVWVKPFVNKGLLYTFQLLFRLEFASLHKLYCVCISADARNHCVINWVNFNWEFFFIFVNTEPAFVLVLLHDWRISFFFFSSWMQRFTIDFIFFVHHSVGNSPYNYIEFFGRVSHSRHLHSFRSTDIHCRTPCPNLNHLDIIWHCCWPFWYPAIELKRHSAIFDAFSWRTPH